MAFNQQLREPRAFRLNSRLMGLCVFFAAALLVLGCKSAPAPVEQAETASTASDAPAPADDMTATEAAIAGLGDAPAAESSGPTAQLLRPDAPLNYTVKRGDTLWDISAVFLKDPWFWPEIWQINPQVENPHLIYPGDVLSLAVGANGEAKVYISQYGGARLTPRLRSENVEGPIDSIPFAAIAAFLSKPGVLTKEQALRAPHIVAFRDGHMIAGTGHEIYVKDLNAPLNQRFSVMNVREAIYDPETRDVVGYQAAFVATAIVNAPGDVSKAVLIDGAREAQEGDRLISQEGEIPLTFRPHAPNRDVDGQIIGTIDRAEYIGQYQVVVINRGTRHGVDPGVVLAIDQKGEVIHDRFAKSPWTTEPRGKAVQLPYERAGTMIVFKVFDRISYGLVIGARGPMKVADRVYNPSVGPRR